MNPNIDPTQLGHEQLLGLVRQLMEENGRPRAQAAAHLLHYGDGIPQRKAPGVLKSLTGLPVTQGALTQSALRLGTGPGAVAQVYEQLREKVKEQEAIHTDDTGWRIGGQAAQ